MTIITYSNNSAIYRQSRSTKNPMVWTCRVDRIPDSQLTEFHTMHYMKKNKHRKTKDRTGLILTITGLT